MQQISGYGGQEKPEYYSKKPSNLQKLNKLDDWHVMEGDPDIRGWNVMDRNGDQVGKVDEFLVSTDMSEVVFLLVSYGGILGMGGDKSLIPMDKIDIDRDNKVVHFNGTADDIKNSPDYTDDTRNYNKYYDYWSQRMMAGQEAKTRGMEAEGRMVIPEVEEHLEVGKREEQVGEVEVHKEVETRPETAHEEVRRTKVHVTRREVEPREVRPGEQVLREGETISIPVTEEKVVAEVRPEVTGEVVIEPETVTEEEEVTRQVRKEHVEVQQHGEAEIEEEEEEEEPTHRRQR